MWVQFVQLARSTDEFSEWLTGPALEAMISRFPGQMLTVVCDYRLMTDRDLSARARMLQTAPAVKQLLARIVLIPSLSASPAHMQTFRAAADLLRSSAIPVELHTSVDHVLTQLGLQASTG